MRRLPLLAATLLAHGASAVLAPGCGLSLTAGGLGWVLTQDDDDEPAPNSPPTGFVATPSSMVNDVVRIEYRVLDAEGDAVDVRVGWSKDGGATWSAAPATAASGIPGHDGTTGLGTAPDGVPHVFLWNSYVDLLDGGRLTDNFPQVRVRIEVTQADGLAGPTLSTGTFAVMNRYAASPAGGLVGEFLSNVVSPAGLARASDGDLVIADSLGHKVVRLDSATGALSLVAGTGKAGFNGNNILATAAELNKPTDVAIGPAGDVFIADSGNSAIRRVDAATGFITTVAGGNGTWFSGDGGDPRLAQLSSPESVDLDLSGNLFIADTGNNRIRFVNRGAASVTFTYYDTAGAGVTSQTIAPNTIATVAGPGFLLLNDNDDPRTALLRSPKGVRVLSQFGSFLGYAFCDSRADRVRVVNLTSPVNGTSALPFFGTSIVNGQISTVAGSGTAPVGGGVGDGGAATSAVLKDPAGLSAWEGLFLFVADTGQNRVRMVDPAGTIQTLAGTGGAGFSGDGGIPQLATVNGPQGVLADPSVNVFVSDTLNHRVRMVNLQAWTDAWAASAADVFVVGGTGSVMRPNGSSFPVSSTGSLELLLAVAGSSATDVVAVGTSGTIRRWNGTAWSGEASGTTALLLGAWALSATNQVAVGQNGTILRWNGSAWSAETSGTTQGLNEVWAASASAVFAVGGSGTILQYGGSSWSAMTSGTTVTLNGVFGTSSSSVWAVGDAGTIRFWNGATWSGQTSGTTQNLADVWAASANDVWAVGKAGTILRWNGSAWSAVASPTNQELAGVFGSGPNDVYAVSSADVVIRWDGSAWKQLPTISSVAYAGVTVPAAAIQTLTQPPSLTTASVADPQGIVLDAAGNAYVASTGTHQVLRVDALTRAVTVVAGTGRSGFGGDGGTAGPSGAITPQELRGVWGPSSSDVFAVGAGGTILHWNGSAWTATASPVTTDLAAVHGTSGSAVFACGVGGVALRYDGTSWTALATGTTSDLLGVFAAASNDVFFCGARGTLLRWNGTVFSKFSSFSPGAPTKAFRGIWGSSAGDVFAVGDGNAGASQGPIWRWNGSTWTLQVPNDLTNLWSVWGTSGTNVWAVGDWVGLGVVKRWNGSSWTNESLTAWSPALRTVFGRSSSDALAAGVSGGLHSTNGGGSWAVVTTTATADFRAGVAFPGGPAFLVGEGGSIYRQVSTGGPFVLQHGLAMLNVPRGLALSGNVLFVADTFNNRVRAVNLSTTASATLWPGSNQVTISAGGIATAVGGGTATTSPFGDGGPATNATLSWPMDVSVDPQTGDLYIADFFRNRIRRVDSSGVISNYAGTGAFGFSGDGSSATAANLAWPKGVSVHRLDSTTIETFIADTFNQRIRRVDNGGTIGTFAGTGTAGYNADGLAPTATELSYPSSAVAAGADVLILDNGNQRVRRVSGSPAAVSTVCGTGAAGFNGDVKPGVNTDLSGPDGGLAWDPAKSSAFVTDTGNDRVRRFRP